MALRRAARAGSAACATLGVELGLERVRLALARLGDPQRRFAAVQVAGTNGKGSTAAMTEAVLRAAGLRTGLYSSPHLARFTERIRVDGREVDGDRLAALDRRVAATEVPLTYFEVATALAFLAMAEAGVEVAVLETGLGGRLDAVTTCEPCATAITSIGLDHTELSRRHAAGDRAREGRHPQAGRAVLRRAAAARGRRRAGARGGGGRRAAAAARAATSRRAAVPGRARRARTSSDNAALAVAAGARGRPAGWAGRSTTERWRAGWPASAGRAAASGWATTCCSTARTTPTARAPWPRRCRRWRPAGASCCWCRSSTTRIRRRSWRRWRPRRRRSSRPVRTTRARCRPAALAAIAARLVSDAVACDDADAALAEARRRAGPGGLVGGVRLDVPGRDAARARARRAGRSRADVGSRRAAVAPQRMSISSM